MPKILIIDDDVSIHDLIDEEIECQGYGPENIIHAYCGMEGFEKFVLYSPKFVLLDMRMPGIDGFETYKLIKDNDPDANVMLMTGYAEDMGTHDAIRLGVKGYISKNSENYMSMIVSLIVAILKIGE